MEQEGYEGQEPTEERIQELKDAIAEYQQQVERQVEAAGRIGIYYKMLANEYVDREMYGKALESLSEAIYYYPDNPVLHYLAGVSAAHLGASMPSAEQAEEYLMQAERSYRRALELDETYVDALYGLAILYAFELEQPGEALPLLERLLQYERRNVDAMFLLARVYAAVGRIEDAVEMYDRIIDTTQIPARKERARENKQQLLGGSYEQ
jgi:tetratricopeptide (TPR) repeat protein